MDSTCHVTATTALWDSAMLCKKGNSSEKIVTNTRLCLLILFFYTKARVGRCAGHWDGASQKGAVSWLFSWGVFFSSYDVRLLFYTLYRYLQWKGSREIVAATVEKTSRKHKSSLEFWRSILRLCTCHCRESKKKRPGWLERNWMKKHACPCQAAWSLRLEPNPSSQNSVCKWENEWWQSHCFSLPFWLK